MKQKSIEINENLRKAMRSFHRLIELKDMDSPPSLIENELSIMTNHFSELSAKDLTTMMYVFSAYHENERKEDALCTERFFKEAEKYFKQLS